MRSQGARGVRYSLMNLLWIFVLAQPDQLAVSPVIAVRPLDELELPNA